MELQVGNKRKFTFSNQEYEIKEILEKPNIKLLWTWDTGLCPHCKQRIERTIEHSFYRIEILADTSKKEEELTSEDIIIMGDTMDCRRMILPKDKYNEIFAQSNNFKKYIKEV